MKDCKFLTFGSSERIQEGKKKLYVNLAQSLAGG